MKSIPYIVFKYSGLLLAGLCIIWWFCYLSPLNVPEYVPYTPIRIYGALILALVLPVYIIAQKSMLKSDATLKIVELVLISAVIGFISEFLFHVILLFINAAEAFYRLVEQTLVTTVIFAFISFFVAFQLKTRRTGQLILLIVLCGVLLNIARWLFHWNPDTR